MGRGATWLAGLALLSPLAPAGAQTDAELDLARRMVEAFHEPNYAALAEMVDFPLRAAERGARGHDVRPWDELEDPDRSSQVQATLRGWVTSQLNFNMRAELQSAVEVADPDAGLGPVPDRRILRLLLRHTSTGEFRELLLTVTREPLILELEQGPPFAEGTNPAGATGLLPRAELSVPAPDVAWDPGVDAAERAAVTEAVTALLAAATPEEQAVAREQLHSTPHAATAALLERLATIARTPPPDAGESRRLVEALEHITGRQPAWLSAARAGGDDVPAGLDPRLVQDWLRWHARNGWTYTPAALEAPPEAPVAEASAPSAEPEAEAPETAASSAAPEAAPAAEAAAPPPTAPPPLPPAEPAIPPLTPLPSARDLLFPAAADLSFHYRGREVTGREVEADLAPSLREALNAWAETCTRLQLSIVASGHPEHLVVGRAPQRTLEEAAELLDRTLDLLDKSVPLVAPRPARTVVAVIFDEQGARSEAWTGVLDDLVERQILFAETADALRQSPAGLTRRQAPLFLQPAWDIAGEGEYRFENELVGKFTQCLVTARVGELPPTVLWGLDYLAEEHFFQSIYQFDTTGFVYTADHFDWPVRTKQFLEKKPSKKESLAAFAADEGAAGKPVKPQMVTWAALAFLHAERPEALAALLSGLSAVQTDADPRQRAAAWRGDRDRTLAVLAHGLQDLEFRQLADWLDRD